AVIRFDPNRGALVTLWSRSCPSSIQRVGCARQRATPSHAQRARRRRVRVNDLFGSVRISQEISAMRIALIGQAAFAERALETLHSRGEELVHVFAPPDAKVGRPDPLKAKALELGVPLSQPASFKSDAACEQFRALNADLAVLAFATLIVPERILY